MSRLLRTCCLFSFALSTALAWTGCATPGGATPAEKRGAINDLCNETLANLYSQKPDARAEIERAPGYAVFQQIGIKILMAGTGNGYGVAVDNANGKRTFMRMAQLDAGPGLGVKKFRAVFVFGNKQTFQQFVEKGWQFGGQAEAEAKANEAGVAATADAKLADLRVYRITDAGLALQATVNGTKYWKDEDLN
ncbi:MAG: lipid-binding SYLF domain-containing protein [Planctomycetota bacterium]|jgi:lipid-binding SYLF domain-containing protein